MRVGKAESPTTIRRATAGRGRGFYPIANNRLPAQPGRVTGSRSLRLCRSYGAKFLVAAEKMLPKRRKSPRKLLSHEFSD